MLFFVIINNIECFIKINLFELLPYLLYLYEELVRKESFILLFRSEHLNIFEVLERLRIVFRVKVINVINPSHLLTADAAYASFAEAFRPSSKIQEISELEFIPPKIIAKTREIILSERRFIEQDFILTIIYPNDSSIGTEELRSDADDNISNLMRSWPSFQVR